MLNDKIIIKGDYYTGLATYRQAVRLFVGFLKETLTMKIEGKPLVQYCLDVPVDEKDEALRKALEDEYPKILQFAQDILGAEHSYIPVYLSKKTEDSCYDASKSFLKKLEKKLREGKRLNDLEAMIFQTKQIRFPILGRFINGDTPYIEIYYRNLPSGLKRIPSAFNCLAHEYMHFLHFAYARTSWRATAFHNKRVKEALADFFAVLYSIHRAGKYDVEVANDRYNTWKNLEGSGWPYAYALYFYQVKGDKMQFSSSILDYEKFGCVDKFRDVFKVTPKVMDAYNNLTKL